MTGAIDGSVRTDWAGITKCSSPPPRRPHPAGDAVRRMPCPGAPDRVLAALAAGDPGRPVARMASPCGRAAPASRRNVRWSTGWSGVAKPRSAIMIAFAITMRRKLLAAAYLMQMAPAQVLTDPQVRVVTAAPTGSDSQPFFARLGRSRRF